MALRIANLLGANLMAGGRQGLAIQQGALFAQAQAALGEPAHGQRVDPVFFLVNPSGQAFRRILRLYRDYCLYDQWPPSSSSVTKCTLQPCSRSPASRAR